MKLFLYNKMFSVNYANLNVGKMDRLSPVLLLLLLVWLKTAQSSVSHSPAAAVASEQGLNYGCGAAPVIPLTTVQILTAVTSGDNEIYHHSDNEQQFPGENSSIVELNNYGSPHASTVPSDSKHIYLADETVKAVKLPHEEITAPHYFTEGSIGEIENFVPKKFDEDGDYDYYEYSPEPRVLPVEEKPSFATEHLLSTDKQHEKLPSKDDVLSVRKIRKVFQDGDFLHKPGSIALYVCDEGHQSTKEMQKSSHVDDKDLKSHPKKHKFSFKLVCKNGQWQGKHFQCGGCEQLPHIKNGYHVQLNPGYSKSKKFGKGRKIHGAGTRVQVLCHAGYELHGSDVLSCSNSGRWLPPHLPRCLPSPYMMEASTCSPPVVVAHASTAVVRGLVSSEGALHGTLVRHSCHRGYRAAHPLACNTSFTSRCDQSLWLGTIPICERVTACLSPPVVHHSVLYEELDHYPLRSRLHYRCAPGHRLQGPPLLLCEATTGCWSPARAAPHCVPTHTDVPLLAGSSLDSEDKTASGLGGLDMYSLVVVVVGCVVAILLVAVALLLYRRSLPSKRMSRLHNSTSNTGGDLAAAAAGDAAVGAAPHLSAAQHQSSGLPRGPPLPYNGHGGVSQGLSNPRFSAKAFADSVPQGVPPSYEECTRQVQPRPPILDHLPSCGRPRGCGGRTSGPHRAAMGGGRRSRHRDNPDNISYQSVGSARHSAASMRSWSACDSLGSTDTMHAAVVGPPTDGTTYPTYANSSSGGGAGGSIASESTNVTLDTMSTLSSAAVSQAASCRALFGSRTSFDSSSLVTNEGAPLLEEAEEGGVAGDDCRTPDQVSQCTRDSEEPGARDLRSPAFSLHE